MKSNKRYQDGYTPEKTFVSSLIGDTRVIQLCESCDPPSSMLKWSVVVYHYESWMYDWYGCAYCLHDRCIYYLSLCHCSCNWPWDGEWCILWPWMTFQEDCVQAIKDFLIIA